MLKQLIHPKDIFLFQVGQHDQDYIVQLINTLNSGQCLETIDVAFITDSLKNEIKFYLDKLDFCTNNPEIDMFRNLLLTKKTYIVLDGHHRTLASLATDKTILANIDYINAKELGIDYLYNLVIPATQ